MQGSGGRVSVGGLRVNKNEGLLFAVVLKLKSRGGLFTFGGLGATSASCLVGTDWA